MNMDEFLELSKPIEISEYRKAELNQEWLGVPGGSAFSLIDHCADNWEEISYMMNQWLVANSVNQAEIDQLKSECTLHKDRVHIAKDLVEAKDKRIAELESRLCDLHASSVMAEVNRKTEVEYFEIEEFLLSEMAEGMLNELK